jgi:hypothetical protein
MTWLQSKLDWVPEGLNQDLDKELRTYSNFEQSIWYKIVQIAVDANNNLITIPTSLSPIVIKDMFNFCNNYPSDAGGRYDGLWNYLNSVISIYELRTQI